MKRAPLVTLVFTLTMIAGAGTATAAPPVTDAGPAAIENPGDQVMFDWECDVVDMEGEVYMFCANDDTGATHVEHLYSK